MDQSLDRPDIYEYDNPHLYIDAMIKWRRASEKSFSVNQAIKEIGGCSPSLVYLVAQGRRSLTLDHTRSFSKLMGLNLKEKIYFEKWVSISRSREDINAQFSRIKPKQLPARKPKNHLLTDWLNMYVKESINHKDFKEDPEVIAELLGNIAPPSRIQKSLNFLIREGFVKRNEHGKLVLDEEVSTTTKKVPDKKIRNYHRRVFDIAKTTLENQPLEDRTTTTFLFAATEEQAEKYHALVDEFMDQVQELYHEAPDGDEKLYQMVMHFSPVGGNTRYDA